MNKFLRFLAVFFIIISCSKSDKKNIPYNDSTDYLALNYFIKDSLPKLNNLNKDYINIFNKWKDIEIIIGSSKIISSDSKQLSFLLDNLKIEIKKINDKSFDSIFNVPQIIGRFRVHKTNVLKINSNKIDSKNIQNFKNDLKGIVISYNALINMINKIAKESFEKNN